jgi:hypothetical protein
LDCTIIVATLGFLRQTDDHGRKALNQVRGDPLNKHPLIDDFTRT